MKKYVIAKIFFCILSLMSFITYFFTEKSAFMALGGVFLIVAAVVYAFEINKSKKIKIK